MPFLQIFADQLSQTAASRPGANVKHPSSAAVWAYAHLDNQKQHRAAAEGGGPNGEIAQLILKVEYTWVGLARV